MIKVSKEEMKKIKKRFPDVQATRTVHYYYIEERRDVVAYLRNGCRTPEVNHA